MNTKNKQKGFTLVELVIVIAVIAILAGVLIPTFSGVVENAKKSSALQNCKNTYQEAAMASANVGIDFEEKVFECDGFYFEIKDGALTEIEKKPEEYAYYSELDNDIKLWSEKSGERRLNKGEKINDQSYVHNCAFITFAGNGSSASLVVYDEDGNVYYSESLESTESTGKYGFWFCMFKHSEENNSGKDSEYLRTNTTEAAAEGWYSYKLVLGNDTYSSVFYYSAK